MCGDVIAINNITSVISALAKAEDDVLTAKLLLCVLKKSDQAIIKRMIKTHFWFIVRLRYIK